ncbi:MAG: hypothetical protein DRP35_03205 [Candidatus Zixiibacteriota bacterium]|nr:MAG: hypothetical protein DRP35_03205 [candidate division Zixibacteria bacterium]
MRKDEKIEIVVVDDEKYICGVIDEALSSDKLKIHTFTNPLKALEYIEQNHVDLVLTDLVMGQQSGIQVLETTLENHSDAVVILMTAHPTVQAAISVLRKGAYDFMIKPFRLETLRNIIKKGIEHQQVLRENLSLKGQVEFLKLTQANIVGTDLDTYLDMIAKSCRNEFSACGVSLVHVKPNSKEIIRTIIDSKQECYEKLLDEKLLYHFDFTKSTKPVIRTEEQYENDSKFFEVMISKPIFERRKLHGVINILIKSKFGKIIPGQLDLLSILSSSAGSAIANNSLYEDVQKSYIQAIKGLANSIEARDQYTSGHTDRVLKLSEAIAKYMNWTDKQIEYLIMGCTLHDIGKLGVPDSILNKPDILTDSERKQMQKHPELGMKIINGIDLFKPAIPYIMSHHEWYDGSGYPNGLKGEKIPIEGRLLTVADTFDAIISDRPYRKGRSVEIALNELIKYAGTQFDPYIVNKFIELLKSGGIDLYKLYDGELDFDFLETIKTTEKVSV